ncbi:MAG TPA: RMD1 family protein [Gammaproteobacteria bacterium]|jgi:uncharacterized Rmd1/YagE family protein|nr:RMD1 family protein [Gammaproteobacteria bacterium]
MSTQQNSSSYSRCVSSCTASSYDILGLASFFRKKGYETRLLRDVLHISSTKRPGDVFVFSYGCFVCWGHKKKFEDSLVDYTKEFAVHPMNHIETDQFSYVYGDQTTIHTDEKSRLDIMTLASDDSQIKLAMSYGLAQSIKLESFEEAIRDSIRMNNHLSEEIASRGIISLSRRAIFKRIGEIFIARSSINLNIEYLESPEFFWRNPNLEPYYIAVTKFLDISSRVIALNQKLDVLQELLNILNSQVEHRHSSFLEKTIILLILAEIIITLFRVHFV